ncbi:hypothetical protein M0804_013872 [Polistes exclamans]|nr:hypothetical protein M0804_013872 [Polistes exclamans]
MDSIHSQTLYKLKNNGAQLTEKQASDLHFIEKSTLINEDAVTCTIYFNKLVNVLMNILESKKISPFGKYRLMHYFKCIEFQHRGSQHAHLLLWLENAPKNPLGKDYISAIEMIDELISVSAREASGNIKLQTHEHISICCKQIIANRPQKC